MRDLITQLNAFLGQLNDQKDQITTALDQIETLYGIGYRYKEG